MFVKLGLCLTDSPQNQRLAARCLEPVSAGERAKGREALAYTQEMRERPQVSCVLPEAKELISHTQPHPVEKDLFYISTGLLMRGDSLVSLEAQTECQSCHGGG